MKNASQIITSIQYQPQYKKILHHKCINRLISILLPTIQRNIKHSFINKNILHITISAALNKYDKDNIINTIKMVLNSKMILESEKFYECKNIPIDDVIVYVSHTPKTNFEPFSTNAHKLTYFERASGEIEIDIQDEKLKALVQSIQDIIKKEKHDS